MAPPWRGLTVIVVESMTRVGPHPCVSGVPSTSRDRLAHPLKVPNHGSRRADHNVTDSLSARTSEIVRGPPIREYACAARSRRVAASWSPCPDSGDIPHPGVRTGAQVVEGIAGDERLRHALDVDRFHRVEDQVRRGTAYLTGSLVIAASMSRPSLRIDLLERPAGDRPHEIPGLENDFDVVFAQHGEGVHDARQWRRRHGSVCVE